MSRSRSCSARSKSAGRRFRSSRIDWSPATLHDLLHKVLPGTEVIVISNREPYIHNRTETGHRPADAGQRPGVRARAGHARLRRHLDRSRQRHATARRSIANDTHRGPAGRTILYAAARLDHRRGAGRLLLRPRQRRPLAAVPHRLRAARHSGKPTGSCYETDQPAVCRRGRAKRRSTEDPIVLVQDYHFALAPRMIRERLPKATIITFWHIPWPNAETFGICPWKEQISTGCSAAASWAFIPSSTATTSSSPSIASWKAASTASSDGHAQAA